MSEVDRQIQTDNFFDKLALQSSQLDSIIDLELLKSIWNSLGMYISKQLRSGRAITIPNLGQFNFSYPEISLEGTTNPIQRDKQQRMPVFLVSSEFIKGKQIKKGIYTQQGLRVFGSQGFNGKIQQLMINYTEVAIYSNVTKDIAKTGINRIIRQLADIYKRTQNAQIMIPQVGYLFIKNNIAAVSFNHYLRENTKNIIKQQQQDRLDLNVNEQQNKENKKQGLTKAQLRGFERQKVQTEEDRISIDSGAKSYLMNSLGINVNALQSLNHTLKGYDDMTVGQTSKPITAVKKRPQSSKNESALYTRKVMLDRLSSHKYALRKYKEHVRLNNMDTEEAFIQLVQASIGNVVFNSKLSLQQFTNGMQMLGLELSQAQIQDLFSELDMNKDGYIDFRDYSQIIQTRHDLLQRIRDVIQLNNLETDDVLMRMRMNRYEQKIDLMMLKERLMRLDEGLDMASAMKLAQIIMKEKNYIDAEYLLVMLEVNDEESKIYNIHWYKNILIRLRKKLINQNSNVLYKNLLKNFENYDTKNQGLLDVANYKTVLLKSKLGLNVDEINRMVRYAQKKDDLIDYVAVMEDLYNSDRKRDYDKYFLDLNDFVKHLKQFINETDVKKIIKQIIMEQNQNASKMHISVNSMVNYLMDFQFPDCSYEELDNYVQLIDIDKDGMINEEDLDNFIKKYKFTKKPKKTNNFMQDQSVELQLYPIREFKEDKIDIILRDLKQILQQKKISYYDFFNKMDKNQDGFISFDEFDINIEPIMRLSQKVKEGLFSYFDNQKVGLIDYATFIKRINKPLFIKQVKVTEDNFEWQENVIDQIRRWQQKQQLTVEEAFKTIDADFDGFISKDDLHKFLIDILKYGENDFNQTKLVRLFKLMDQYKRGKIQFLDFKRLITENQIHRYNDNQSNYINDLKNSITGGFQKEQTINSFDWIKNAKQQIGLVLSRKFSSIQESFDIISSYKHRLLYEHFKKYIEENQLLNGFDLTEKLLLEVYSQLDPHKKGYLTLNDWKINFGSYEWQNQMDQEIQQAIDDNFETIDKAYQYFSQSDRISDISYITEQQFNKAIHNIFPNRFNQKDLQWYWQKVKQADKDYLSYQQFVLSFDKKSHHQLKELTKPKSQVGFETRTRSFFNNKDDLIKSQKKSQLRQKHQDPFKTVDYSSIVEKVRNILRQADKTIDEVFKEYTDNGINEISNLQFRNLFKQFNLGLTIREFDALINTCNKNTNGFISINHFKKQIQPSKIDKKIIERAKARISQLRQDMYDYMVTPKNAFRLVNIFVIYDIRFVFECFC